jgi:hypothetical protein
MRRPANGNAKYSKGHKLRERVDRDRGSTAFLVRLERGNVEVSLA